MQILKKHGFKLLMLLLILAFAGGWALIWKRIGDAMDSAAEDQAYTGFLYDGAYYTRCSAEVLARYTDQTAPDASCRGESVGDVEFETEAGTLYCEAYSCTLVPEHEPPALLMLDRPGDPVYELSGFQSLDDAPSAAAVCAAYGIASADDLSSVRITEGDGTPIDEITAADDLAAFYAKLTALGEDIGRAGMAQAYYDVYLEKYGESGGISLENGEIRFADKETETQAMALWSEGLCLVTIRLKSGLQLRDLVYAPVPKAFAVYGSYRLTEPFFS
jgi:hypothetical protein